MHVEHTSFRLQSLQIEVEIIEKKNYSEEKQKVDARINSYYSETNKQVASKAIGGTGASCVSHFPNNQAAK